MRLSGLCIILGAMFLPSSSMAQTTTILENFARFECQSINSGTYSEHISMRIDNKRGLNDGNFVCFCSNDRELKKFSGTITDANGKVVKKIKRSDLTRSEYSTALASDDYRFIYQMDTPLGYPITVTYDWEVAYTDHLNSYPPFHPIPDYEVAVDTASYTFIAKAGNTLSYRILNFEPQVKTYDAEGNRHITEFTIGHMKHMDKQDWGPTMGDRAPQIILVPNSFDWGKTHCDMTDWKTFGCWINQLNEGRENLTPEVKDRLHQATDTCTTDKGKVIAARKLLGEMTRYISIQLGIGGYQTASAEEVCKNGIGDCKALSNCFCAMLHEIGLPAIYTLIGTNNRKLINDMPNFSHLNHAIAQVPLPGDTLWVECTNDICPADYRHLDMCGHDVILVHPEGGEFYTIPEYADSLNLRQIDADIEFATDGSAELTYKESNHKSQFEALWGITRMSAKDQREKFLGRMECGNPTIQEMNFQTEGARLDYQLKLNTTAFCKWSSNRFFLPQTLLPFAPLRNTKEEAHVIDLMGDGKLIESTIRYKIPEGYVVDTKLDPLRIESPFGYLTRDMSVKDNILIVKDSYLLRSGLYPAEQFAEWVSFRKALSDSSKKKVVLKKTAN